MLRKNNNQTIILLVIHRLIYYSIKKLQRCFQGTRGCWGMMTTITLTSLQIILVDVRRGRGRWRGGSGVWEIPLGSEEGPKAVTRATQLRISRFRPECRSLNLPLPLPLPISRYCSRQG